MAEISQGDYRIYRGLDCIYLQHLSYNKILTIEKFSCNLYESDQEILNKVTLYDTIKPHAILGIIRIGSIDFLMYVKSCQAMGTIEEADIFKIKEAELLPICDDIVANNLQPEVKSFISGIKNFLALGFFYSFHYDLTNSRQKQAKTKSDSIFDSVEKKFFWNFNLYKKFLSIEKKNLSKIWMIVCICGYVGITEQILGETKLGVYLISRRSINHAGTRYNTRGIDDEGHVANFLESEQIVKCASHVLSYVQVRGSAPIFFQQTGMTAQTQITRNPELASPAFLRHVEEIQKDYQMMFFVNLMNNNKPNERTITQNMENQIKMNNLKSCKYYFFDFQNECKYDNYDKLDTFIKNLESVFNIFKFYCEDVNSGEIHKEQCGVVRTNCLDCLDRTNVIQTRIAWKILEIQLSFLNVNTEGMFEWNFQIPKAKHPLMEMFKEMWADNGDFISIQYAGTASTISTVTKNGKHGFLGLFQHGLVSLTRFYQGSFEDSFKQKCFDVFLQKAAEQSHKEELKKHENKYTSVEELFIYIGSWNVAGKEPKDGFMFFEWLFPMKDMRTPDLYVIGLQEIVDLNAKNIVLSSNSSKVDYWRNSINKHLNEIDKYVVLKTLDLVGIFVIVFIKESLKENVKNIDSLIVRTGLLGTMGNKGSCLIRFNYLDTSFAVAVAHLSAGSSNVNARITEINDILNRPFPNKPIKFKEHDATFLLGDLNFRIDLDFNTCKQMILSGSLSALNSYDQLNKAKSVSTSLMELDEGPLNFDPTYKYVVGTSDYDAKKKRVPSWCDRILFKKSSKIELVEYNRIDYMISDHKPIYGLYKVACSKVDIETKNQIRLDLKEKTNTGSLVSNEEFPNDITSHISDDFFNSNKLSNTQGQGLAYDFANKINLSSSPNEKTDYGYSESMKYDYDDKNKGKEKKKSLLNNILTIFKNK